MCNSEQTISQKNETNAIFISKLSMERCRQHLAHMHALIHMERGKTQCDDMTYQSMQLLLAKMEDELRHSATALDIGFETEDRNRVA